MKEEIKVIHPIPVDPLPGSAGVPLYWTSKFELEEPVDNQRLDYFTISDSTRRTTLEDLKRHKSTQDAQRRAGVKDSLIRLLNGIEEAGDLI